MGPGLRGEGWLEGCGCECVLLHTQPDGDVIANVQRGTLNVTGHELSAPIVSRPITVTFEV